MPSRNYLACSSNTQKINGKIYPDGRCGWSAQREVKHPPVNGSDLINCPDSDTDFDIRFARQHGVDALSAAKLGDSPLGLANVPNSHTPPEERPRRGLQGISNHGRMIVRNSAEYLQWRFGKRHLSFVTLTLPGVTYAENAMVTKEWPEIVRIFNQSIARKLKRENLPQWVTGCYEIQPERFKETGLPVLHYHLVCVGRRVGRGWAISPVEFRKAWRAAVVARVPALANYSFVASEKVVRVLATVSGYLSKYLSKFDSIVGDVVWIPGNPVPTAWYTASSDLRRIVLRSVRTGGHVGEFLSTLEPGAFLYRAPIECVDESGVRYTVGWFGILKPGWSVGQNVLSHYPSEEDNATVNQFKHPKRYHDGFSYITALAAQ